MNVIQGTDAIISFNGPNGFTPFVCTSDVAIAIEADLAATRTVGDGPWKKTDYQAITFSVTLSGVFVFADPNIRSWDLLLNQIAFISLPFRLSFFDDASPANVKSMQGVVTVKSSNISGTVGQVVKGQFTLQGSGALSLFDGIVPCPTTIDTITVNGQTGNSGIVTVLYTYTGDLYQIRYQIDGSGSWIYAQGAIELNIPGLSLGNHSIDIIPICTNGFEGVDMSQEFVVTQNLTCDTTITAITVDVATLTASYTYTGSATQIRWSMDQGASQIVPIGTFLSFKGLALGNHTIFITPICTINGQQLRGTGADQGFVVTSQPTQSVINYNFSGDAIHLLASMNVYINGVLAANGNNVSGTINVPINATVRVTLTAQANIFITPTPLLISALNVTDTTTATVLSNQSTTGLVTNLTYTFTANGDTFGITMSIN